MEVCDVKDACCRGEARRLVETRGVHAKSPTARVQLQDPSRGAVGDEHAPARVHDDGIRMPSRRRRHTARIADRADQRGRGEYDGDEPEGVHPRPLHRAAWRGS